MTPGRFDHHVRACKAAAAAVALLIVALRVVDEFALTPSGTPPLLAAAFKFSPILVLCTAFLVFGAVFRPLQTPPPGALRLRPGKFVVPGSPIVMGRLAMGWALVGATLLDSDQSLTPTTRLGVNTGAALVIAGAAWPLLRGPRIVLTPAGLHIRAGGRRRLAWDDLIRVPLTPLPITVRTPKLALSIRRPDRPDPGWLIVPLDLLSVEPTFLGRVLEHYVDHPAERGAIGTPEEYARLLSGAP